MSSMERAEAVTMVEEITVAGRIVRLQYTNLPIYEVHLDPRNQRVQFILSLLGRELTEEEIAEKLWHEDDVKQLYHSIKQNQGLLERIIVRADGTIAEGNCRTVVYRKLYQDEEDERWAKIPASTLPEDITEREIAYILGELHVAGKIEWDAYEQAAYLYGMAHDYSYTVEDLSQHLRKNKAWVNKRLWAYQLMKEQFLKDSTDRKDVYKWSYFEEFYKAFKKKEAAGPWEDRFVRWVRDGKLSKGVQVRDLPKIVANPEALAALEESGYDVAWHVLTEGQPELGAVLYKSIDRTIEKLHDAPASEIRAVRDGDSARIKKLQELQKAINDFADLTGLSLS
ncbi:hypothetical protein ES703_03798 [subsurface metagenome]